MNKRPNGLSPRDSTSSPSVKLAIFISFESSSLVSFKCLASLPLSLFVSSKSCKSSIANLPLFTLWAEGKTICTMFQIESTGTALLNETPPHPPGYSQDKKFSMEVEVTRGVIRILNLRLEAMKLRMS